MKRKHWILFVLLFSLSASAQAIKKPSPWGMLFEPNCAGESCLDANYKAHKKRLKQLERERKRAEREEAKRLKREQKRAERERKRAERAEAKRLKREQKRLARERQRAYCREHARSGTAHSTAACR